MRGESDLDVTGIRIDVNEGVARGRAVNLQHDRHTAVHRAIHVLRVRDSDRSVYSSRLSSHSDIARTGTPRPETATTPDAS